MVLIFCFTTYSSSFYTFLPFYFQLCSGHPYYAINGLNSPLLHEPMPFAMSLWNFSKEVNSISPPLESGSHNLLWPIEWGRSANVLVWSLVSACPVKTVLSPWEIYVRTSQGAPGGGWQVSKTVQLKAPTRLADVRASPAESQLLDMWMIIIITLLSDCVLECYAVKAKWNIYPEKPLLGLTIPTFFPTLPNCCKSLLYFLASALSPPILNCTTSFLNDTPNLLIVTRIALALSLSTLASDTADYLKPQLNFPLLNCTALVSISLFHLLQGLTFSLPLFWEFIHSPNSNYHIFDSHIFISTPISLLSSSSVGSETM